MEYPFYTPRKKRASMVGVGRNMTQADLDIIKSEYERGTNAATISLMVGFTEHSVKNAIYRMRRAGVIKIYRKEPRRVSALKGAHSFVEPHLCCDCGLGVFPAKGESFPIRCSPCRADRVERIIAARLLKAA